MKVLSLLLLATLLAAPVSVADKVPAARAKELLAVLKPAELAQNAAVSAFQPALFQMQAQGLSEVGLAEVRRSVDAFFGGIFTDPRFEQELLQAYANAFSEAELTELTAFYSTPTGQKSLTAMPALLQQSMTIGEKLAAETAPAFQAKLAEIMKTHGRAAPKQPSVAPAAQ